MKAAGVAQDMRERSTQDVDKEGCQVTAKVRAKLAERIGPERYGLWFNAQTQLVLEDDSLTVRAPSVFVRDWLRQNFRDDLRASAEAIVAQSVSIEFEVEPTLLLNAVRPPQAQTSTLPVSKGATAESETTPRGAASIVIAKASSRPTSTQSAKLTINSYRAQRQMHLAGCEPSGTNCISFGEEQATSDGASMASISSSKAGRKACLARFVVGPSNEYAYRTADLTARGRQQASPLIFYGRTGVGKTHLLRGLHLEYRRRFPRARSVYLSAEQFTTAFIEALRGGGLPSFRQKCRGADLLAIDDLQFFVGKQRTVEELQQTVDMMLHEGRQLVMASVRPLAELHGLGIEMTSRLAGGLACEIAPPEFVTRVGILRDLCAEMKLSLCEDVLSLVASQITAGARELRGALHRLEAVSYAYGKPISRELADEALREIVRQSTRAVRLGDVQQAVCEVFGVEAAQLRSDRKGRALSEPRMLAMWLARKYTRAAWSEIGEFFGRRSHSTVISAHHRVEKMIASQAEVGIDARPCGVEEAIRRIETALRTA